MHCAAVHPTEEWRKLAYILPSFFPSDVRHNYTTWVVMPQIPPWIIFPPQSLGSKLKLQKRQPFHHETSFSAEDMEEERSITLPKEAVSQAASSPHQALYFFLYIFKSTIYCCWCAAAKRKFCHFSQLSYLITISFLVWFSKRAWMDPGAEK